MEPVRKAVFPVAGFGTRFLPATKASSTEMLAVVDKPLIQYAVEEAVAFGITDLIFVTGRHKRAIEDHFDACPNSRLSWRPKASCSCWMWCKHLAQQCELHFCATAGGVGTLQASVDLAEQQSEVGIAFMVAKLPPLAS